MATAAGQMTLYEGLQEDAGRPQHVLHRHMDVQADEDDCMATMGYMFEQHPQLQGCELAVSPRVSAAVASESIKMLFMFSQLRHLQLRFDFDDIVISQPMVCAVAELLQLTSLHLLHGGLDPGLDLSHWSSLRSLAELKLLPGEEGGLRDEQMRQLTGLSSSLTSLAVRPNPEGVTADSLAHLASLEQLQELSLCPLPEACTAPDLQQLLSMPHLTRLQLGTSNAAQVLLLSNVKVPQPGPQLSLLVQDACEPGPAADVLTVISWNLPQHLTALCIGPLAAPCPNDVLVTLATLTNLRSLQLQLVAPPCQHVSGTVELLTLSPCRQLTCLEVLTSSRLYVPFTLKTVSLATLAWPHLAALRLSLAGKRELMPEALDMCDNFTALKELQLFSPLEDSPIEDLQTSAKSSENGAAPVSTGWTGWAAASLSSLGLFRSSTKPEDNAQRCSTGGSAGPAGRMSEGLARAGSGMASPLTADLQQRDMVRQQHWKQHEAAHQQHLQAQHSMQDAAAAHSHHGALYTLQKKQLLPAAVGSFQHHKIVRADSLFGASSSGKQGSQGNLDRHGTEPWSPTWLLKSFVPFGSPGSPGGLSTADSSLAQQQPQGTWGLLDACRGTAPRAASLESSQALWVQQQQAPSRLQHSSSAAHDPAAGAAVSIRRTLTISGHGTSELQAQQQRRSSSPVSAPGLDLAMYRQNNNMVPFNLNYLPNSLTKLCLQSYHLVAIGMPEPSAQCSSVSPAVSDKQGDQQQEQHEQQQDDSQQAPLQDGSQQEQQQQVQQEELRDVQASADRKAMDSRPDRHASDTSEMLDTLASAKQMHGSIVAGALAGQVGVSRAVMTEAGAAPVGPRQAQPGMGGRIQPGRGSSSMPGAGSVPLPLPQLPLPHLLHLELDSCRIDDDTMAALLKSSPSLRTLEIAGLEGLTDTGLQHVSSLQQLTRLCVEAEETTGISMASLAAVRRLHRLKKLHWCSRDSLHGPLDTDLLTAQLSGLTGLRQLVLLVAPDSEAAQMSGWRIVLQRRLPLCRLVLRRELLVLDAWGDIPEEDRP